MTWWQVKLLRWGIRWCSLKTFSLPPKIIRVTVWRRVGKWIDVLVYYRIKKKIYYKQLSFFGEERKPFKIMAPRFFKFIVNKKNFFRDQVVGEGVFNYW